MKKLSAIILFVTISIIAQAQTTAWIKQLNEEENFVAAGSGMYFTVSKTPYNNKIYTVRSFNASGIQLLYTTVFPNSPYTSMQITKVIANQSNELYILGNATSGLDAKGIVIKLSSTLLQSWQTILSASTYGNTNYPVDIALQGSNILVLTRKIMYAAGIETTVLARMTSSSGVITATHTQPTNNFIPYALHVAGSQNIYYCGSSGYNNGIVVKFNSSLTQLWAASFSMGSGTWFNNVVTDVYENVYVAGNGNTPAPSALRALVRKYNSSGTFLSGYTSSQPSNINYWVSGFRISTPGNLFVAIKRTASGSTSSQGIIIQKHSSANVASVNFSTTCSFSSTSFTDLTITGFEVTQSEKTFVTARSNGTTNLTRNYITAKLRANGTQEFSEVFNNARCNSVVKAIPGSYPNDEFVTTGSISNINMLIKYTGPGARLASENTSTETTIDETPACYPNPASSKVTITGIDNASPIYIYDSNGRLCNAPQVATDSGNINLNVESFKEGIYFIRTGYNQKTIRLVVKH